MNWWMTIAIVEFIIAAAFCFVIVTSIDEPNDLKDWFWTIINVLFWWIILPIQFFVYCFNELRYLLSKKK